MSTKHPSPTIIVHSLGFLVVLILSFTLISYNLFHTSQNNRFTLNDFLKPATLRSILTYRYDPHISCTEPVQTTLPAWLAGQPNQLVAPIANSPLLLIASLQNGLWTISLVNSQDHTSKTLITNINYSGSVLTKSFAPIVQQFVYPDCTNDTCYLNLYDLSSGEYLQIPAFASADKLPLPHIRDVFFDESRKLISYGSSNDPLSSRIVINNHQELLHTIDETPSSSRPLQFISYNNDSGLLRYHDPTNGLEYFYSLSGIGLYRKKC